MKFHTKYSHASPVAVSGKVSVTDQQYRNDCDIDTILKRYRIGEPLPTTARRPIEGDFTDIGDYMNCLEKIRNADESFRSLPAVLRAKFDDNPMNYFRFVLDADNTEACYKLGLRVRPDEKVKVDVTPVDVTPRAESSSSGDVPSTAHTTGLI